VKVPYSLGTHTQTVTGVSGELFIDREALAVTRGRLVVPITSMRSDSAERDCHMREALGLDYARSRFPEEHACDDEDRLPATGPDSVAHAEVRFDVQRGAPLDDPRLLDEGKEVRAFADGTWTIHGVARPARIEVRLSREPGAPDAIRVRGQHVFSLRDHGIVVKSAKILFVTISVRDEVTASLDVLLKPVSTALPDRSAR
jgi:polyisoprenoid-binding protein YceI